ncbi:MAG: hypothetical protein RLZZ466_932 [Bacteroidota bacterium]|jgi:uncharacterized protein (DUF1800 family)
MDRRGFIREIVPVAEKQSNQQVFTRTQSGLNPYTGAWGDEELLHLLRRTMFGAKRSDLSFFRGRTVDQVVDALLNPTAPAPAPPIKEYANPTTVGVNVDTAVLQGTTWVNNINNDGTIQALRRASYKKWLTGNLINQDRSIREKMILFWTDHFGNEATDVGNGNWIYSQHQLIRQHSLGNFKNLIRDITLDVAMLRYLNGYLNNATAPDENYARELMELFTLGKGPDSRYTETDVKEAAKVLTGWTINGTTYQPVFTPTRHSTANKTFSSFFNNTVITGRTGTTAGALELEDLLTMIFAQQEVAKFIARRVYRWFVYYQIDADAERNVITPLADIFRRGGYEIKPMLSALLKSEHFYDKINRGCYIKSPADHVIGSLREMNVVFPPASNWSTNYGLWNTFYSWMTNMGMNLHDPPNVAGYPAYYQEPSYHELWITSDSLPKRNQFTDIMVSSGYAVNGFRVQFNCLEWARSLRNPGNPNDLLTEALSLFYQNQLSDVSKDQIKMQILLTGQQWDYYWTNAWMAYESNPTTANFNIVNNRLKSLFQYLFNLSEYQLI